MLSSLLEEISTGTGAAFAPGTGEQIASPFAFKRKRRIREAAPDSIGLNDESWDKEYQKQKKLLEPFKSQAERYINVFEAYDIISIMEEESKVEGIIQVGEKAAEQLRKISKYLWDLADDASEKQDKAQDQATKDTYREQYKNCLTLENQASKLESVFTEIVSTFDAIRRRLSDYKDNKEEINNNQ